MNAILSRGRLRQSLELSSLSVSRDWFLLSSKINGVPLSCFMMTSPSVASFPDEFRLVSLEELKMACTWIDVFTKMLSLLPLHSALFLPFYAKSARNQTKKTHTAG